MQQPFEQDMQPQDDKQLDNRSDKYTEANDRPTEMTDLDICLRQLEEKGYTEQYRVEKGHLVNTHNAKLKYKAADVKAVNFFRFEGITDPDDMSILLAIETADDKKGTLIDAYGTYSDDETGEFLKEMEIQKKVRPGQFQR